MYANVKDTAGVAVEPIPGYYYKIDILPLKSVLSPRS